MGRGHGGSILVHIGKDNANKEGTTAIVDKYMNLLKKTKQARVGQIILSGIFPVFGNRIQEYIYMNSKRVTVNGMTIAELSDSEDRRLNAILFNVTEVENADSDERIKEENARATEVLEEIGMSTEIIETRRLGKFNATNENPWPLRITMPNLSEKMRLKPSPGTFMIWT